MNNRYVDDTRTLLRLNTIISLAESLPVQALTAKCPASSAPLLSVSEHIISFALDLTLDTQWKDSESEHFAGEIESILAQLDVKPDSVDDWHALFTANKALSEYLKLRHA